jgi:hypothetical protein
MRKRNKPVGSSERVPAPRHPLAGGKPELEIFGERVRQPRRESARAWRAPDDAGL